jgi:molybdopterin synthase sulfur carrier subunit
MATVLIPVPLRGLTGGADEVDATGATVAEVIERLEQAHAGIKSKLCTNDGAVRPFVNIYVNNQDIRFMQSLNTPIGDRDELSIMPAIAGGN